MLNVYEYFDEPKELSLFDEIGGVIEYLNTPSNWSTLGASGLKPILNAIKKSPDLAYYYAVNVVRGRWEEAEPVIIKDPEWAYRYARDILRARWPEAEPHIKTNDYAKSSYEFDFDVEL